VKVEEQVRQVARHKPRWFLYKIVKKSVYSPQQALNRLAHVRSSEPLGHSALEDQVPFSPLHP
jgi:hypothetical protein